MKPEIEYRPGKPAAKPKGDVTAKSLEVARKKLAATPGAVVKLTHVVVPVPDDGLTLADWRARALGAEAEIEALRATKRANVQRYRERKSKGGGK